jgi:hypothetical protein
MLIEKQIFIARKNQYKVKVLLIKHTDTQPLPRESNYEGESF